MLYAFLSHVYRLPSICSKFRRTRPGSVGCWTDTRLTDKTRSKICEISLSRFRQARCQSTMHCRGKTVSTTSPAPCLHLGAATPRNMGWRSLRFRRAASRRFCSRRSVVSRSVRTANLLIMFRTVCCTFPAIASQTPVLPLHGLHPTAERPWFWARLAVRSKARGALI